jgi:hypothetical protein
VFFERLCMDCRVDKLNRRITMGACLLLAYKFCEPNIGIDKDDEGGAGGGGIRSKVGRKGDGVFSSLLEWLAQEWSLGPKELFSAEVSQAPDPRTIKREP